MSSSTSPFCRVRAHSMDETPTSQDASLITTISTAMHANSSRNIPKTNRTAIARASTMDNRSPERARRCGCVLSLPSAVLRLYTFLCLALRHIFHLIPKSLS